MYGQSSCDPCPVPSNPCKQAAGRSTETGQCVYVNEADGLVCDYQSFDGVCRQGQCIATDCAGVTSFGTCDAPLGGGPLGVCVEDVCVPAAPEDPCVRAGVGRINCCSQAGCSVVNGAYCNDPLPNGTSCDPSGVEPASQTGLDGICTDGTCVAQTGPCAGLACPTYVDVPCVRKYCDPELGQCAVWPIESFSNVDCYSATGHLGVCAAGSCTPY